ncbi:MULTISPECIES: thioredoxin family protein [Pirellulaceae]|nr:MULTISPECIES: thioredoxin family protein [Pirellulaceae]
MMPYDPDYHEDAPTKDDINRTTGKVVLDFGANWCPYCQELSPSLQSLLSGAENVRHIRVADGKGKVLGRSFRVKLWPTLVLLQDGELVAQLVRPSAHSAETELAAFLKT